MSVARRGLARLTDIIAVCALIFVIAYASVVSFFETIDPNLIRSIGQSFFASTEGKVIHRALAGTSIVLYQQVERRDTGCFADYFYTLTGPVTYQFPPIRSHRVVFNQSSVKALGKTLLRLPADLPSGTYRIKAIVYPTCSGIQMMPYPLQFQTQVLTIKIEQPFIPSSPRP